jgi:5,5'-dehydrodivanillate O-demethylase
MLTQAENEQLSRVGAGTPMGDLLRRYWQPIAATPHMDERWTMRVRLMGEDLVLFRDRGGKLGLIGEACPHRRASLAYGIPTAGGIRCPYHGWQFDGAGRCLEQPNEPESLSRAGREGSSFKDKVSIAAYPVQVLGGLIFAYLGPLPAPFLPKLDGLVAEPAIRLIGRAVIPCNWLQVQENSVDPVHAEWLHGHFAEFVADQGKKVAHSARHVRIAFDEKDYGFVQRRLLEGQAEDCSDWRVGHPIIFPNLIGVGSFESPADGWTTYEFQYRTPVDDEHMEYLSYTAFVPAGEMEIPAKLTARPFAYDIPLDVEDLNVTAYQDFAVWTAQGAITDRSAEHLGSSDRGITMFRNMLRRELANVAAGRDPMFVNRDPAKDVVLELPMETKKAHYADGFGRMLQRRIWQFAGINDELLEVFNSPRSRVADLSSTFKPSYDQR